MIPLLFQATNETLNNASSSLQGSVGNAFGLVPITAVVLIAAVGAVFIGSEVRRIQWLHAKLQAFSETLYYTVVGLATTLTLTVVVAPMYYLSQADGQTQAYVGYAIAAVVGGYVVFTVFGYAVDSMVLSNVREYRDQLEDVEVSND